jgi:hypothetical protein
MSYIVFLNTLETRITMTFSPSWSASGSDNPTSRMGLQGVKRSIELKELHLVWGKGSRMSSASFCNML